MAKTKIEWCDSVWNPVTGCSKVSAGCKNCYAERVARRFWGERKFTEVRCHSERLAEPLKWRKPRRIFVNSMSDLFHEDVSFEFVDQLFAIMQKVLRHNFIILTKRPERAVEYFERLTGEERFIFLLPWLRPNVWMGVSVEDQTSADERIPLLFQLPSVIRFVSAEPMLGPIDLTYYLNGCPEMTAADAWAQTTPKLDWVICGGETGPGARPMDVDWALSLRNQCKDARVPFFFKQMGGKRKGIPQRLAIREFPRED